MTRTRRSLRLLGLVLVLTLASPVLTTGAEQSTAPAASSIIDWILDWLGTSREAAEAESGPDADPNGLQALPLPSGEPQSDVQNPQSGGESGPDADPDG